MSNATLIRPTATRPTATRAERVIAVPARAEAGPHGTRLTRRGQALVVLVALASMLVGLAAVRVSTHATSTATPVSYATVVVQPGQTLWSIARGLAPVVDPRVTVAQLIELNHLDGGAIAAGQRLQVPSAR